MNTIFWSWQSDLDARVTRDLIRDALVQAIADLDAELDERLEMTSDTKGVAGSPDIVATILAKIEKARVFVGDVTPLAISRGGKALANPNVLIELGYAKHAIGLERIILIWNTAFEGATIEQLPFDMRGRRSPMAFHLPVDASTTELRGAREALRNGLREALRLSLATSLPADGLPQAAWQPEVVPGLWFDPSAPLAINEDGVGGAKPMSEGPYRYVRILPRSWKPPADYWSDGKRPSILGPTDGYSWGTTRGGFLTYSGSLRAGRKLSLRNLVMQFRATGEIWGVDPFAVNGEGGDRFFADAAISHFFDFILRNVEVLGAQRASGPFQIIMGISDLRGLHWTSETRGGGFPRALEDSAQAALSIEGPGKDTLIDALVAPWGKIAEAFGLDAPLRETLVKQLGRI